MKWNWNQFSVHPVWKSRIRIYQRRKSILLNFTRPQRPHRCYPWARQYFCMVNDFFGKHDVLNRVLCVVAIDRRTYGWIVAALSVRTKCRIFFKSRSHWSHHVYCPNGQRKLESVYWTRKSTRIIHYTEQPPRVHDGRPSSLNISTTQLLKKQLG